MSYKRKEFKKDSWEICDHPFKTFIPPNADKLIIGTFPTHAKNYFNTFDFYYGGEENRFWKVLEKVFTYSFKYNNGSQAIEERESFLVERRIGITDMLQKCYRRNGRSQDEYLSPIILRDVFDLLKTSPLIKRLVLTSRTDVYGALGLLCTYFMQKDCVLQKATKRSDRILETYFLFKNRKIEVLIPHSTSPSNKHVTFDELVQMYSTCLNE